MTSLADTKHPAPRIVLAFRGVVGVLMQTVACFLVWWGLSDGLGTGKIVALIAAQSLAIVALVDKRAYWLPRILMALFSLYLTLIVCEVAVSVLSNRGAPRNPSVALKGMYTKDNQVGYRLTPGFEGLYDDGRVQSRYSVNSLGHRDDEPSTKDSTRVLLIGDSMTFGKVLDQAETIDKHIETLSGGQIDAYNLGVGGYGPPAILETLRRCTSVKGESVVYLFFNNDLREDNLRWDNGCTVLDGYLVRTHHPGGQRFSRNELRQKIREVEEGVGVAERLWYSLRLRSLRSRIPGMNVRRKWPLVGDAALLSGEATDFSDANIAEGVSMTLRMRDCAMERNSDFAVSIIPTRRESRLGRYSSINSTYMARLKAHDIPVIEVLEDLSEGDYFDHDGHFNASGARKTAKAILEHLQDAAT